MKTLPVDKKIKTIKDDHAAIRKARDAFYEAAEGLSQVLREVNDRSNYIHVDDYQKNKPQILLNEAREILIWMERELGNAYLFKDSLTVSGKENV